LCIGLQFGWNWDDTGRMTTFDIYYVLPFFVFLLVVILYIMRRRVRQGRKKGTF
jgi:predicted RND superfamily exporter protein